MSLDRRFWQLVTATGTCDLADGVGRAALPLVAASATTNPVAISGLTTFVFLPWLLFALPSGALVDRVDRRYAMLAANMVRAGAAAVLTVLLITRNPDITTLYVVAFALGSAETVYDSAVRGLLPDVVAAGDLDRANSVLTVSENVGQSFAGAPLGSLLFAIAIGLPIGFTAVGFLAAAGAILFLRGGFKPARGPSAGLRADIADGVRWLARHRFLRALTLVSAGCAFAQAAVTSLLVLYVLQVLQLPSGAYGIVLLVAGAGAIAGGLATPWIGRRLGRGPTVVGGCLLTGSCVAAMALTTNAVVAATLYALAGAGIMTWNVLTMSLRQTMIPPALFGRVQGAYRTLGWGPIPLGALTGGVLASHLGLRTTYALAGVLLLALGGCLAVIARRHRAVLATPRPAVALVG